MNEKTKMNFRDNLLLPLVQEEFDNKKIHSVNPFWKPPKFDNGLCFMFEYDAFKRCGLENENLIYHGFDDWERYCRVRKLGYDIHNSHGLCYHLYHPQKNDGWYGKDNLNFEEFARVLDLCNYQLKLEVEKWEWACDRTSPL